MFVIPRTQAAGFCDDFLKKLRFPCFLKKHRLSPSGIPCFLKKLRFACFLKKHRLSPSGIPCFLKKPASASPCTAAAGFMGCQGGGEGIYLNGNEQASAANSRKSAQKPTPKTRKAESINPQRRPNENPCHNYPCL